MAIESYAHVRQGDERRALAGLPDFFPAPEVIEPERATGTEGEMQLDAMVHDMGYPHGGEWSRMESDAPLNPSDTLESAVSGSGEGTRTHDPRIMIPLL
jgi:hypothetical protein